jgi:hypothetical protein
MPGQCSSANDRHEQINWDDPHTIQRYFDEVSGGCSRSPRSSVTPSWCQRLSQNTIPQVVLPRAVTFTARSERGGCRGRFRPTARYSAATTACVATQLLDIAAEYRAIVPPGLMEHDQGLSEPRAHGVGLAIAAGQKLTAFGLR